MDFRCILVVLCLGCVCRADIITELYDKVIKLQVPREEHSPNFKQAGSFGSDVKLNFHGGPAISEFREIFSVYDNNAFATMWLAEILVEAHVYGVAPRPEAEVLNKALTAASDYQDHNRKFNNSVMNFWPQVLNKTTGTWVSAPQNLLKLFEMSDLIDWKLIGLVMEALGLDTLWKELEKLLRFRQGYLTAFHIPPDMDDTSINLGLGALLNANQHIVPEAWQTWNSQNSNLTSIVSVLHKYSYRPLSANRKVNTIDPRTYFYIHKFLEEAKTKGEHVALVATWIQDLSEVGNLSKKEVAMPFFINNVDSVVCANAVYGMTATMLSSLSVSNDFNMDDDLKMIYENTTSFVSWVISHNISSRPDLAMTYYPSRYNFYWFTSRSLFLLESRASNGLALVPHLSRALFSLREAMRVHASKDIMTRAQTDEDGSYVDGFVGNADKGLFGQDEPKYEDRLCNTAVAANALISTWTYLKNDKLYWVNGASSDIQRLIQNLVSWVESNALKSHVRILNTFFSGSVKGQGTLPFEYPANRWEFFNGTKVHNFDYKNSFRGMEGVISAQMYEQLITNQTHFHLPPVVRDFHGYNADNATWPFWTSEAFTYGSSLLATSQYRNIQQ